MQTENRRLYLVDWTILPAFLREGIQYFSFNTTDEAQVFSDLLVSRIRCSLLRAPTPNQSLEIIGNYTTTLHMELLGKHLVVSNLLFMALSHQLE